MESNGHHFSLQDVNWWTGVVWIIVMFLSAVWNIILTAPIHCRGSTGDVILHFSKSVSMKKQTHLHLEWVEGEYILSLFLGGEGGELY